nr:uncharacterized protein LOC100183360 [Ciona intestinalis]|eukprot:XP_002125380.3 uncharacterized protein LOC100183360 [Ciona intestinalis]
MKWNTLCLFLVGLIVRKSHAFDQTMVASAVGREVVDATLQKIHESGIFTSDYEFLRRIAYAETKFGAAGLPVNERGGLWQIDDNIHQLLTTSTTVTTQLEAIRNTFNLTTFLTDAIYETPLESALAARLYIQHVQGTSVVPAAINEQATWWAFNYRTSSTSNVFEISAAELGVNDFNNCGSLGADIIFLVDGASSIGATNFQHLLDFVLATGEIFNQTTNRYGLTVFATTSTTYGELFNVTSRDFLNVVAGAMQPPGEPSTWIGSGIQTVLDSGFQTSNGARPSSMAIPKILVLVVANPSNDQLSSAELAHAAGITTFVVGTGNALTSEMNQIAEDPDVTHTFHTPTFTELSHFSQQLANQLCRVSTEVQTNTEIATTIPPGKKFTFKVAVLSSSDTATLKITKSKTTAHGIVYISGSTPNPSEAYYDLAVEIEQGSTVITIDTSNITFKSISARSKARYPKSHSAELYVTVTSTGATSLDFTFNVSISVFEIPVTTVPTVVVGGGDDTSTVVIWIIIAICVFLFVFLIIACRFMCVPWFLFGGKTKQRDYPRIVSHDIGTSVQNLQDFQSEIHILDTMSLDVESIVAIQPEREVTPILLRDEDRHQQLRRNLEKAMAEGKNWKEIQRCLDEFERSVALAPCGEEDYALLEEANKFIFEEKKRFLHKQLLKGIEHQDYKLLKKTLEEIDHSDMTPSNDHVFDRDVAHARHLLERTNQLEKAREAVMSISQTMISEIRSYGSPPDAVKSVMISTYLLLGENEDTLQDWKVIRALLGRMGKAALKRRVVEQEAVDIKPSVAARVSQVINDTNIDEVEDISKAISYFYAWCDTMLEEVKDHHNIDNFDEFLKPSIPVERKKLKKNKVSPIPIPVEALLGSKPVSAAVDAFGELDDRASPEGISREAEHVEETNSGGDSEDDDDVASEESLAEVESQTIDEEEKVRIFQKINWQINHLR